MIAPPDFSSVVRYEAFPMRVQFRDVDGWGLVWHGNYFAYIDAARIELLKKFDIPFRDFPKLGFVMPVVRADVEIKASSAADDDVMVEVAMRMRGALADTIFRIRAAEKNTAAKNTPKENGEEKLLVRGYTRQAFTDPKGRLLYHVPEIVAEKFARLHAFGFVK